MILLVAVGLLLLEKASTSFAKLAGVGAPSNSDHQQQNRNLLSCMPPACRSGEIEFWPMTSCCPKCMEPDDVDCEACPFGFTLRTPEGTCRECSCTVDGVMDCVEDPDSSCSGNACRRLRTDSTTPTWCEAVMIPPMDRVQRPYTEKPSFDCSQCPGKKHFYDGCTSCTCTPDGEVGACDWADCGTFGYEDPHCHVDCSTCEGKTYFDGCRDCECDENGQSSCSHEDVCEELGIAFCYDDEQVEITPSLSPGEDSNCQGCVPVDCAEPKIPEGGCCPICLTDTEADVPADGDGAMCAMVACDTTWQVEYTPAGERCPQCLLDETKYNYDQCPYGYMYPADDGTGCYVCPRPSSFLVLWGLRDPEPCDYLDGCLNPITAECTRVANQVSDEVSCRTCGRDGYVDGCGRTCSCMRRAGSGVRCHRNSCQFQAVEPKCVGNNSR